jgi:hypothetical protein
MTTVDKVHDLFMSFKGRSPQQVYVDACKEHRAKPNSKFRDGLSDTVDDFWYLEDLDVAGNYFGGNGCLAVLVVAQCQQRLRMLSLRGCGADDAVVNQLVEILQDHPRLRRVDLGDNPGVSVYCGKGLTRAVKLNVNVVEVQLDATHIGANVAATIAQRCQANLDNMEAYFSDDYFRMKDMFLGLDVDGSGWVNIKTFVSSVIFPRIQEKLEHRIATMKPTQREDHCIDVNTFLALSYQTYKNRAEIAAYCENTDEVVYDTIKRNWALLYCGLIADGAMCDEMHKIRIREGDLTAEKVSEIVAKAKQLHADDAGGDAQPAAITENGEDENKQQAADDDDDEPKAEPAAKKQNDDEVIALTAKQLWDAQQGIAPSPLTRKRKSFMLDIRTKVWFMPPSMVREVVAAFDGAPASGILADTVLSMTFETPLEKLKLGVLRGHFLRYAIPVDVIRLTLAEVVNVFEEYYEVLRVAKPATLDEVKALAEAAIKADSADAQEEDATAY